MPYIDTSILVAYYCPEPMSERVEAFLMETKQPTVSDLTEVEMVSAVSCKVRENHLTPQDAHKIILQFQAHVDDQRFRRLAVEPKHFRAARNWIARFSTHLRTLDALHLAIASTAGLPLVTADARLKSSADLLGIEAVGVFDR
jgi:predicted nucleic acid-binding protein